MRVVDRIRVPSLIITAADDPFVPSDTFRQASLGANPRIEVIITEHGGHCGFLGMPVNGDDGYWAERTAIEFAARHVQATSADSDAAKMGPLPASSCLK
jgi:hypothetical protein